MTVKIASVSALDDHLRELGGPAVPLLVRRTDAQLMANPAPELQLQAGDVLVVYRKASDLNPLDRE